MANLAERVVEFIQERDPFGDHFSHHDISQIERLSENPSQSAKTLLVTDEEREILAAIRKYYVDRLYDDNIRVVFTILDRLTGGCDGCDRRSNP